MNTETSQMPLAINAAMVCKPLTVCAYKYAHTRRETFRCCNMATSKAHFKGN